MIRAVIGLPGSGKTLHATKEIRNAILSGRQVYSNVHVNDTGYIYYEDFALLTDARDGLIILDEAQVYINARNWASLPPTFQFFLQRHRHNGLDLLALTQSLTRTDKVFRELVQEMHEVKINFTMFGYGIYTLNEVVSKLDEDVLYTGGTERFLLKPRDWEYYNTHAYASEALAPVLEQCIICNEKHVLKGWEKVQDSDLSDEQN